MPEGVYPIVEAKLYLARAPKSNSANDYFKAVNKVEEEGKVQVPQHLRDANRDARDLGHGQGYVYPNTELGHHLGQQYLPTALLGTYFYSTSQEGYEAQVQDAWPVSALLVALIKRSRLMPRSKRAGGPATPYSLGLVSRTRRVWPPRSKGFV